ncbi:MAG: hypothetical protein IPO16_00970 [Saprospiraceae bacterium]|nr:hypothetical protein [Saprospiraceae bacterium]
MTIIELTIDERIHRSGEQVLENICRIANTKAGFIIKDANFFDRLILGITTPCKRCYRIHNIEYLYAPLAISDQNGKKIIKQKVIEYLENKFDPDFYERGISLDIFTKEDHKDLLQKYIAYANKCCSSYDVKEERGIWIIQNYSGFNCISCLAYLKVDFKHEDIQSISKKSDYYNWLINFDTYDYSNFNTKWLTQLCPEFIKTKLNSIESLKEKVSEELKKDYDNNLAEFFIKYLN